MGHRRSSLHSVLSVSFSLNLVILRIGFVYGPYVEFGLCKAFFNYYRTQSDIPSSRCSSHQRGFDIWIHEEAHEDNVRAIILTLFPCSNVICSWGPGKDPVHSVHVEDVAGAMWACAQWMTPLGRKQADALAGEKIYFHNDKDKVKEVDGTCPANVQPVAPLFNLVCSS